MVGGRGALGSQRQILWHRSCSWEPGRKFGSLVQHGRCRPPVAGQCPGHWEHSGGETGTAPALVGAPSFEEVFSGGKVRVDRKT